jgi:hypothetical protein
MTDRELMQQALDALINAKGYIFHNVLDDKANQYDTAVEALRARLAQPEPEPVAWYHKKKDRIELTTKPIPDLIGTHWKPLYPRPPRQGWIGLTDEEFKYIVCKNHNPHTQSAKRIRQTIKEIEAKLKEKNNG